MGTTERDDNDQSAYPCPSPLIDRGSDDLEDLMVLPCQVWFDTEAPEAFERDDLIATTEQHLRTVARSEDRIESPREISANSKFLNTSVGTQKVDREFAVRNVTKLRDAAGQLTDEGLEMRPSEADSKGRTRREDDGREVLEVFASIEWHERECCDKDRNASDNNQ